MRKECFSDQEMWERAVAIAGAEYAKLSDSLKNQVVALGEAIRQVKLEIYTLAGGGAIVETCVGCGGLCCQKGKYHFSVIDLLIYFSSGKELFSPSFRETPCPFLGEAGCLMDPEYRPFTCITFHCELLEELPSPAESARIDCLERRLRAYCQELEELFGRRMMQGLLLNCDRYLRGESVAIFNFGCR